MVVPASVVFSIVVGCAVCGAADRTLPSQGNEVPFEGRKRATVELRAASFVTTDRTLAITELRAQPGVAMAVGQATMLDVEVPLLRRSLVLDDPSAPPVTQVLGGPPEQASSRTTMLGDVELRATHTAWRSAPAPVVRRLSIAAGVKLPTAPLERDPAGREVHPDLQPGCGSVVPLVAVAHAWSSALWSVTTSASLLFPVSVRDGSHPGDSLRASLTLQLQPTRLLATRLGVHGRLDGTGEMNDEVVRRSGGASAHLAPELVLSPVDDVVVSVGASFPVVQQMRGYRATAPVLIASVGVDF